MFLKQPIMTLLLEPPRHNAGSLDISLDEQTLGNVDITNTGGWHNYQDFKIENVNLESGNDKVLKIKIVGAAFNVDYLIEEVLEVGAGLEDGTIENSQISSSSVYDNNHSHIWKITFHETPIGRLDTTIPSSGFR